IVCALHSFAGMASGLWALRSPAGALRR
ncbi:hypothetical protein A2U01_0105981, partial [Trifolium medium]|nr:hypothetical protein [Trifolium medium]